MEGIIISNKSNLFQVKLKNKSDIYTCYARGKIKNDGINPVVGDRVIIEINDNEKREAVIERILDRDVFLKRPKLSNLTKLILVISSNKPKPDLLMLDKQLVYACYLGLDVLIVLNKIDLDDKKEFAKIKEIYSNIGYKVLETNAVKNEGVIELKEYMKNNINVFAGNSGVGKSSLINALFNKEIAKEGDISTKNNKGKNTTTQVSLYEIDNNTFIADTPGFSTFDIFEINSKDLDKYFVEFDKDKIGCRYVGCTHIKEQECGIKDAINEEKIDKGRYHRYCLIYNELKDKEERENRN